MSTDIADLMSRDPLKLTKDDRREIIKAMRAARHTFNSGVVSAGAKKNVKENKEMKEIRESFGDIKL